VEDIFSQGGGVVLDRDWLSYMLESVYDLEEELRGFKEVLHAGCVGVWLLQWEVSSDAI
jgi:hypothetical protein